MSDADNEIKLRDMMSDSDNDTTSAKLADKNGFGMTENSKQGMDAGRRLP